MDSYRCARLHNRFSCKCATSFVRLLSDLFRNFIRKMSDIMNSTFCLSEQRFTFEDYLEQQSFDDETPTNSTYNQFNGPLTFEVYLYSCSALDSFNTSPCTTDSSDNSSFSLSQKINSTISFSKYLQNPMTTRFYIRYDDPSFFHFCDSQNYLHIYGFGSYCK